MCNAFTVESGFPAEWSIAVYKALFICTNFRVEALEKYNVSLHRCENSPCGVIYTADNNKFYGNNDW